MACVRERATRYRYREKVLRCTRLSISFKTWKRDKKRQFQETGALMASPITATEQWRRYELNANSEKKIVFKWDAKLTSNNRSVRWCINFGLEHTQKLLSFDAIAQHEHFPKFLRNFCSTLRFTPIAGMRRQRAVANIFECSNGRKIRYFTLRPAPMYLWHAVKKWDNGEKTRASLDFTVSNGRTSCAIFFRFCFPLSICFKFGSQLKIAIHFGWINSHLLREVWFRSATRNDM